MGHLEGNFTPVLYIGRKVFFFTKKSDPDAHGLRAWVRSRAGLDTTWVKKSLYECWKILLAIP